MWKKKYSLFFHVQVVEVTKEYIIQAVKEDDDLSPYDALHYVISRRYSDKILSVDQDFKERMDPCSFSL
jgi:predicted nucleic acid-binding protein